MMSYNIKRGVPIGAFTSQPIGNFSASQIDHHMKEKMRVKCYLRYCDDATGRAKTKAQARRDMEEFERVSSEIGLVVKHSAVVAPIGIEKRNGRKKNRKRKRSKRSHDRLSRISIYGSEGQAT